MILVTEGQKPVVSVGERQGSDGIALLVKIMYNVFRRTPANIRIFDSTHLCIQLTRIYTWLKSVSLLELNLYSDPGEQRNKNLKRDLSLE